MTGNSEGVSVSLDAMLQDAIVWRQFAADLGGAHGYAATLDLTADDFSFIANGTELVDTYQETQSLIVRLLGGGRDCFADIADRLETVVERYERSEQEHRERLRRVTEIIEEMP
jgi:hypothetical protein